MIQYKRTVEAKIKKLLFKGKVVIIYGPRQVGKTTLAKKLVAEYGGSYYLCEEPDVNAALTNKTSTEMKAFLGNKNFIVLDEAQKVLNIGTSLKLLVDAYPDLQIVATGSSSFDLANRINEPLTGRNYEVLMYPLSIAELAEASSLLEVGRLIDRYMQYGTYPGVVGAGELAEDNINKIANDYLYKDVLAYDGIRKPDILKAVLQTLAFQVGQEVSYSEVAARVRVNKETVRSYIDVLEKAFIIARLYPLHRNKRNEITAHHKIYFYDNGVLNALLRNYNGVAFRDDVGRLFENFFVAEMLKRRNNESRTETVYFWRNKSGGEVDYVEEYTGGARYAAYECKYGTGSARVPPLFNTLYTPQTFNVVTRANIVNTLLNGCVV